MRKKIVGANWKMNHFRQDALGLYNEISQAFYSNENCDLVIFPSQPFLSEVALHEGVNVGAQNFTHLADFGAFTGETSLEQLKDLGVRFVLVGHSERRYYFQENNASLTFKTKMALEKGFQVIFCCGENESERKKETHFDFVRSQIEEIIALLEEPYFDALTIAYEPVWSIGTGLTPSLTEIQDMHAFIRKMLREVNSEACAEHVRIIYGGSCNAENSKAIFALEEVDGGLIGGASMQLDSFMKILEAAC